MKRFFVETEDYTMVAFVDDEGKAFIIDETSFDEVLTFDVAKNSDYSNLDGCETAEECAQCIGTAEAESNVIDFDEDEYTRVIEF